jgi:hypothetical protein
MPGNALRLFAGQNYNILKSFIKTKIMYEMIIDPNKWIKISDAKLENEKPYWCQMTDGRIVMAAPYSNGTSSGMAVCFIDNNGIMIKSSQFYILRDSFIQPVISK